MCEMQFYNHKQSEKRNMIRHNYITSYHVKSQYMLSIVFYTLDYKMSIGILIELSVFNLGMDVSWIFAFLVKLLTLYLKV